MDRRDQLLDELSTLGQVSVEDLGNGSMQRRPSAGPATRRSSTTRRSTSRRALSAPSGRLGALRDLAASPGGRIASFRADLNTVAKTIADAVNDVHDGDGTGPKFFDSTGRRRGRLARPSPSPPRRCAPPPPALKGANDLALAASRLRGGDGDSAYRAFVARVGGEVSEANRQEANAQALADSVEDRRQSVAGVSLDEEMTGLIRFQRAYQASSRAMSTMDEMLDVLINRTGRVGLLMACASPPA